MQYIKALWIFDVSGEAIVTRQAQEWLVLLKCYVEVPGVGLDPDISGSEDPLYCGPGKVLPWPIVSCALRGTRTLA